MMAEREYFDLVQKGMDILLPWLSAFVCGEMRRIYKEQWWEQVREALTDSDNHQLDIPVSGDPLQLQDSLDMANCLRLIQRRWKYVFSQKLSLSHRNWASELMGVRNTLAHQGAGDLSQSYAERALDTMALLCESIDAEATEEIRALYRKVRYGSEAGTTGVQENALSSEELRAKKKERTAAVLKTSVGENLPSWRDVMEPHPDVAEGRYKAAEFAADLSQVAKGEGAYEYRDPVEFFNRTYVTEGMKKLLVQALERVTGRGGEPVIQLKTAFGGGKTHSMLALYHLLRGKTTAEAIPVVKPILKEAGITQLPQAHVAVLVGTAMNPAKRSNPPTLPGYTVSTIWGEMAAQLVTSAGKPELYGKYIRDADRNGTSPGSEALKNLFNECGSCLVLMDELVAYGRKLFGKDNLPAGTYDNFITFIQEVTEAARASENSLVVASIPESDIEIGGTAGQKVLETIEHTFGRMEAIWKPVAANEGFEVVRRRLFLQCKDPEARERVCEAFSEMYQENAADFPLEAKEVDYKARLISSYPIHPEVFDRLYEDWATLENFQRTRGVLRLMAAVIHALWMASDASAMIMPGSITLDTSSVRDELLRYLPENWNSIVDNEVDGKESIPYQKDQSNPYYGQRMACRRVARTIMLGSAPSTAAIRQQGIRGIEISRILLGTVQPGENPATFKDALNTLHGSLSYLYYNPNGDRYWYDTKPTLKKVAEDRASQISSANVDIEIRDRLKKIRKEEPFSGIHICPSSSNDVPDDQSVRLVVLWPTDTFKNGSPDCKAMAKAKDFLDYRGTAPRVYRNTLVFVAPDSNKIGALAQEVKRYLAWKSIDADKDKPDMNLDGNQVKETQNSLSRSNATVDARLKETYCWLLVPYIDQFEPNTLQWDTMDMGGGSDSIVKKAARSMEQAEQVVAKWAPAPLKLTLDQYLWKNADHISVRQLWIYLCTYCYLPRVARYGVLEEAIRNGVSSPDFFALAAGYDEDKQRYLGLKWNEPVFSVNPTDLLVKVDVAKTQIDAERAAEQGGNRPEGDGTGTDPEHPGKDGGNNPPEGGRGEQGEGKPTAPQKPKNTHFYLSATLDGTRVIRDVDSYVKEVIQHLQEIDGATVDIRLEVQVDAPQGIPDGTVRTVSENCRTLKADDFGFDK
jgi:hypothetical protein